MQYLLLIYSNEKNDMNASEAEQGEIFRRYMEFSQHVKDIGVFVAGEALQPTSTATSVRVKDGKMLTTDGPFAETKEQLGGYYLLDCKDLDQAMALAAKIPAAENGVIEVRPIMTFD